MSAANAGGCWRKPATTCTNRNGGWNCRVTRKKTKNSIVRWANESPRPTKRKRAPGRMSRSCPTPIPSTDRKPSPTSVDVHALALLDAAARGTINGNAALLEGATRAQNAYHAQAAARIPPRRALARCFTRRRLLLPVPGPSPLVGKRRPFVGAR